VKSESRPGFLTRTRRPQWPTETVRDAAIQQSSDSKCARICAFCVWPCIEYSCRFSYRDNTNKI
jgi:hypothetical protein